MNKKQFINEFQGEDQNLISSLYNKVELCEKIDGVVYSDIFLPPQIWSKLKEIEWKLGLLIETKGLSVDSEKHIVAFKSYGASENIKFPIKLLKLETNSKFYELEHRHFLAGILSIGIKREKIGDLIVEAGNCYTIIHESLYEFLENNLLVIGKSKINIIEIKGKEVPKAKFKEEEYLINSYRLDLIVATLINGSRNEALSLINSSQVMINYRVEGNKSLVIKEGDTISIRKTGKYIYDKTTGETKKGKQKTKFRKYI